MKFLKKNRPFAWLARFQLTCGVYRRKPMSCCSTELLLLYVVCCCVYVSYSDAHYSRGVSEWIRARVPFMHHACVCLLLYCSYSNESEEHLKLAIDWLTLIKSWSHTRFVWRWIFNRQIWEETSIKKNRPFLVLNLLTLDFKRFIFRWKSAFAR